MTERLELQETKRERQPTYDSFGDSDEALAWVADHASLAYGRDGMIVWWASPVGGQTGTSPAVLWRTDPDAVISQIYEALHETK